MRTGSTNMPDVAAFLHDIRDYGAFVKTRRIDKGYSGEDKYYLESDEGKRFLLRLSDTSSHEQNEKMFHAMEPMVMLGVPMCVPVGYGTCNDGRNAYLLLTWCDGEDLVDLLPSLSNQKQYALGWKAGGILRTIHSVPAPANAGKLSSAYLKRAANQLREFSKTGIQVEGSDAISQYFEANKYLVLPRPLCFRHGDYHTANLMVTEEDEVSVVDWAMHGYGDPWREFSAIYSQDVYPYFATGLIRGYFSGDPPAEFWTVAALYLSVTALSSICWAVYRSPSSLESCVQGAKDALIWHDYMKNPMPSWYVRI